MDNNSAADMSELMEAPLEEDPKTETQSPKMGRRSYAMGEIVEGKRTKKTIERLDFQISKPKEKLKIEEGGGDKLGDIPRTNYHIGKMKPVDLKPLHNILFDRPGKMATMRKNMRLFNGFPFEVDTEAYTKKREKMSRSFKNSRLRTICKVLDQEKKGTQADLIDRILTFLIAPKNSGRPLLSKKKKKSKKKLSGSDSKGKTKTEPKSASPKKSKAESKSKAIVMDSSSDEDDEDDDKVGAAVELEGSDTENKSSKKDDETEDSEDEEEEEEEDDESPKSKPGKGKAASKKILPVKRQRAPAKKAGPPRKKVKKEVSDPSESDSDSESEVEEKPKKKPAAKTKKADSSSNRKKMASKVVEDSSDDDEPLIKMTKKAPSDEQLKDTVKSLLKEANLEEMTMKQICQRVYDTYPDHDLTSRKDYIKQTVKTLIT